METNLNDLNNLNKRLQALGQLALDLLDEFQWLKITANIYGCEDYSKFHAALVEHEARCMDLRCAIRNLMEGGANGRTP